MSKPKKRWGERSQAQIGSVQDVSLEYRKMVRELEEEAGHELSPLAKKILRLHYLEKLEASLRRGASSPRSKKFGRVRNMHGAGTYGGK